MFGEGVRLHRLGYANQKRAWRNVEESERSKLFAVPPTCFKLQAMRDSTTWHAWLEKIKMYSDWHLLFDA